MIVRMIICVVAGVLMVAARPSDELLPIWPGGHYGDAATIRSFAPDSERPAWGMLFPADIIDGRGTVTFGKDGIFVPNLCGRTITLKPLQPVLPGPIDKPYPMYKSHRLPPDGWTHPAPGRWDNTTRTFTFDTEFPNHPIQFSLIDATGQLYQTGYLMGTPDC